MSGPVIGFISPACGGCGRPPDNQCAKCLSYVKAAERDRLRGDAIQVAVAALLDIELSADGPDGRKAAEALVMIKRTLAGKSDDGPQPGWFDRVSEDVEEKTKDRPAWRRSARVNADLERLKGDEDDG
jgi:hypothetical protein